MYMHRPINKLLMEYFVVKYEYYNLVLRMHKRYQNAYDNSEMQELNTVIFLYS